MANADPARCPSCGAERPADAPEGLCPRCVLRHAMESDSSADDTPALESSRLGPVLEALTLTVGSVRRIQLLETEATAGESDDKPAVRLGSSEMPAVLGDAGHLELLGEIARGGMGAVFKGRDPDLGRDLAVKVLLEAHKDKPDLLRRFMEEAQIAGQLQHPGVVPVYELGAFADHRPYFSMKLVKGRTLASALDARDGHDEDLPRFLSIFEQVCRTMAYAHSRGVIHRDLKPSNIMVGGFGEVQVMDWGLAKVLASGGIADESRAIERREQASVVRTLRTGSDADASQAGSVMGTPAYMAPEQAGGDIEALDERADVFGLGAILCEVLTGAPPYVGPDGNAVFRKALRGDLTDATARLDACGAEAELIALAKSCLAPELLDRPRDARVVAERLTDHLAGVQERLRTAELARAVESARALEAVRKVRAERRARRLTAGLAAAVFIAMALGGGGAAWIVSARTVRRAAVALETNEMLDRAIVLKAKALAAPTGAVIPWNEALAEANRAADRARELADPQRKDQIARVIGELEQGRQKAEIQAARLAVDRKLLSDLETVRGNRAEHDDANRTDAEYAAAFRHAGLDLDVTEPKSAGSWIAARTAPIELASFLDDWYLVRRVAKADEKAIGRLVAAARAADPDPWRDALRAGFGTQGPDAIEALHRLAGDEEALDSQPPESLRLLARRLKAVGDGETAARVLRRAWQKRPDDFWVSFELARGPGGVMGLEFPSPEEAVRHLTAAVAIRPRSAMAHYQLGYALFWGAWVEAVAEFREAIRLKPVAVDRYNAACVAALAGCGQGKDAPPPDEAVRAGLREQALAWLRTELTAWERSLDGNDPRARVGVVGTVQWWKVDPDLAVVRNPDALNKLPETECKAWQALWADVDRLLQRAGGKP